MTDFTTRPEIRGTFGVVTSTHWIASAVGFGILEKGGNAFDAAVACGLVLQVVEPHLNGPAGDLPAILHDAQSGKIRVLCAQGVAPAGATIAQYRAEGLSLVPGSGLLATVVPGAFDGWMLMLRDHGTLSLRDVLEPAIGYARDGHPMLPAVSRAIDGLAEFFAREWPTSAAVWTPGGSVPEPNALFRNPDLADTYERLLSEAEVQSGRDAQIDAARAIWREGFVADAICDYLETAEVMDVSGSAHRAVLDRDDMKNWQASYEETTSLDYHGWRVHKTGPWGQGPVLLQALAILRGIDFDTMDPNGPDFVHTVIEAIKLAYADREAFYGDPEHSEIPMDVLLSEEYAASRRALIGKRASLEQRPGRIPGFEHLADACIARAARTVQAETGASAGEPTMAHLTDRRGDTVHLDVIDRWGNMVSATPSGGWLQSSPVIPGLGFPLNSRAQMFWLEEGMPGSLAPGRRPRTTLTPSLAEKDGRRIAFGTPGGDQQDQWQLIWFLRFVHHGMDLQQGIDAPLFHSLHFQGSFYPREAKPGVMMIEPGVDEATIAALRARGHEVVVAAPWTVGRLTAALREADGTVQGAATPRLMQAYAIGR
ncbi:gamma-glutamyltransferase family protein [Tropicimonas sediminicola]|uniref:Gamma-glutamyltranspeptidase / glutathione hydrolase n=1 Tax=Tropicimonas sediminicola TaxID=1031541 RepID=A0A239J9V8_9RHOB|nr:gamma-glutamyltransferase family protein [Tropicimonas sediminicola]SNT02569.1 gamma-glutamyltranspeptidase / glutathione hydrolase [Tropicimonas sediminicola]